MNKEIALNVVKIKNNKIAWFKKKSNKYVNIGDLGKLIGTHRSHLTVQWLRNKGEIFGNKTHKSMPVEIRYKRAVYLQVIPAQLLLNYCNHKTKPLAKVALASSRSSSTPSSCSATSSASTGPWDLRSSVGSAAGKVRPGQLRTKARRSPNVSRLSRNSKPGQSCSTAFTTFSSSHRTCHVNAHRLHLICSEKPERRSSVVDLDKGCFREVNRPS